MATYTFRLNGRSVSVDAWDPDEPLLYALRGALAVHGPKLGCGLGQCGACAVLIDKQAARACVIPVSAAAGRHITTVEGLGTPERPDPVQAAFIAEQAAQCGYCIAGMIVRAQALLERNNRPTEGEVRAHLAPNLCRCGTHMRILRAVRRAADAMQAAALPRSAKP